jgi:hypothetical protein
MHIRCTRFACLIVAADLLLLSACEGWVHLHAYFVVERLVLFGRNDACTPVALVCYQAMEHKA